MPETNEQLTQILNGVKERFADAVTDVEYPYGDVVITGLNKPFLFVLSDHGDELERADDEILRRGQGIADGLSNWPTQVTFEGSGHFNFSDQALLKERFVSRLFGALGPMGERRVLSATADYVRAFFDIHLRGNPSDLLTGLSDRYPEARVEPR